MASVNTDMNPEIANEYQSKNVQRYDTNRISQ